MSRTGRSDPSLFGGGYNHYDSKGQKNGYSVRSAFGSYNHYDSRGHRTGSSRVSFFGDYVHYDAKGNKTGTSRRNVFGGYTNYDAKGRKVGSSNPSFLGSYTNYDAQEACYVATAVYGSYDCPQVWTLRRFRDRFLKKSLFGRLFIRLYYAVSPALVRRFGGKEKIRRWCRKGLDRLVQFLQARGYESGYYRDGT